MYKFQKCCVLQSLIKKAVEKCHNDICDIYFLTFHMAFKTWIRGENGICSGTAVFYKEDIS